MTTEQTKEELHQMYKRQLYKDNSQESFKSYLSNIGYDSKNGDLQKLSQSLEIQPSKLSP